MQSHDILQVAAWLAATDIDMLELQGPGLQLRLERDASGSVATATVPVVPPAPSSSSTSSLKAVRAASLGVLRDRPPGRAAPLAPPGAAVQAGDLIALLQIGPLLLPVRAPLAGQLGDWHMGPGQTVGYGTHLVDIHA